MTAGKRGYQPNPDYTQEDWDEVSNNPELTDEELANLRPAREVLPPELYEAFKQKARGPQVAPTKQLVPGARLRRLRRRLDLGGVRRRRQVLGVPQIRLPDEPRLVVADRHRQSRRVEEAQSRAAPGDRGDRKAPRARVLGGLRQGRYRQPRPPEGRRHGGRRDPAGDDGRVPGPLGAAPRRLPQARARGREGGAC